MKIILVESARGVLGKTTGLTITDEALEKLADQALKSYSEQRTNKDRLKHELEKMSGGGESAHRTSFDFYH